MADDIYTVQDTPHSIRRILVTDLTGRAVIDAERKHQAEIETNNQTDELNGSEDASTH